MNLMINKSVFLITLLIVIGECVCSDENSTLIDTGLVDNCNNNSISDSADRIGKQSIPDLIGAIAGAIVGTVSQQVVADALGNSVINTREVCGILDRTRHDANRYCDRYCDRYYDRPVRGYCRSGLNLCTCECDSRDCSRYCDHYDDDFRRRRPVVTVTGRDYGVCTSHGCSC